MSVPNLKQIALFIQKLLGGPKFRPAADLGAQDGQNLISWRWSLPLPINPFGEDRCTQIRVIVVTDPHTHTHKQTHRQDLLQYTAPLSLAHSVIK